MQKLLITGVNFQKHLCAKTRKANMQKLKKLLVSYKKIPDFIGVFTNYVYLCIGNNQGTAKNCTITAPYYE